MSKYAAYLHIKEIETGETVHSVGLSSTHPRYVERVMLGMLYNMNRDKFYIDDSEADEVQALAEALGREEAERGKL